jgi:hypothetical protein
MVVRQDATDSPERLHARKTSHERAFAAVNREVRERHYVSPSELMRRREMAELPAPQVKRALVHATSVGRSSSTCSPGWSRQALSEPW